jgi:hypothetical protein
MRYIALVVVLFIAGAALTFLDSGESETYTPVVRVRTESGLFMTVVQRVTDKRATCSDVVGRLVDEVTRTCPSCSVESADCPTKLAGIDRALALNESLPVYSIAADGVRIAMVGPPPTIRSHCSTMAAKMAQNGLPTATCVLPVSAAVASDQQGTN